MKLLCVTCGAAPGMINGLFESCPEQATSITDELCLLGHIVRRKLELKAGGCRLEA